MVHCSDPLLLARCTLMYGHFRFPNLGFAIPFTSLEDISQTCKSYVFDD